MTEQLPEGDRIALTGEKRQQEIREYGLAYARAARHLVQALAEVGSVSSTEPGANFVSDQIREALKESRRRAGSWQDS